MWFQLSLNAIIFTFLLLGNDSKLQCKQKPIRSALGDHEKRKLIQLEDLIGKPKFKRAILESKWREKFRIIHNVFVIHAINVMLEVSCQNCLASRRSCQCTQGISVLLPWLSIATMMYIRIMAFLWNFTIRNLMTY